MKTKVILAGLLACIGINAQAQDTKSEEPKGKAIVQVFENFSQVNGDVVAYGDTETMFNNPVDERTKAYLTGRMG